MKCPNCAGTAPDEAAECPACGLVFAKWRERQEKERNAAAAALAAMTAAPSSVPNPWTGRLAAGAVVLVWILSLCFFARLHRAKRRAPPGVETGAFVEVRDPRTGDLRRMPIRSLAPLGPPTAGAPSDESTSGR